MLKRIRLFTLSVFFLLYTEGLLHGNTHYSFQGAGNFTPAPGLLYSEILQPLPSAVAAAPAPPERFTAAKNSVPTAKRRHRPKKDSSAVGRKSKKPAPAQLVNTLRDDYRKETGLELIVMSGYRPPRRQAAAMYRNFVKYGSTKVVAGYRNKRAAREIAEAYKANLRSPRRAIAAMAAVITRQVGDNIFVSNHLRGMAVDLRSWGPRAVRIKPLMHIALTRGWRVLVEPSHIHVDLS